MESFNFRLGTQLLEESTQRNQTGGAGGDDERRGGKGEEQRDMVEYDRNDLQMLTTKFAEIARDNKRDAVE
eukprot:768601-Hanusia_phi.AAC.3